MNIPARPMYLVCGPSRQQTDDAMTRFIKQISLSKTSSPDGKKSPTTGKNERKKKVVDYVPLGLLRVLTIHIICYS